MKNFLSFALFIVLFFSSCSSVTVHTDYDKTIDFTKYKSFSFYELKDKSGAVSDLNKNRIIQAVKSEMFKKGFIENKTNPDLLINLTTLIADKKSVTSNTNYYNYGGYYRPYGWGNGYLGSTTTYNVYEYKDGSLIIDLIDVNSNQLLWQGIGNKEIDSPSKNPEKTISEAVAKIMEKFPPQK